MKTSVCLFVSLNAITAYSKALIFLKHSMQHTYRDQQWIVFSLLISTRVILSMSDPTVLKFNYSDSFELSSTLIYKNRLQWVWVQRWHHNIKNLFDSYVYSFRFIHLEKYLYYSKMIRVIPIIQSNLQSWLLLHLQRKKKEKVKNSKQSKHSTFYRLL